MHKILKYNPDYIHHQHSRIINSLREVIFGLEDGMVSTLGSITGVAIGSGDQFTVLLAGFVIIAVESISMGVGSYLSSRSEWEMNKRMLWEESQEISEFPNETEQELKQLFTRDGWPSEIASRMTKVAKRDRNLMLREMRYRELHVHSRASRLSWINGLVMFFSYIIGGLVPLISYFFLPINMAISISIPVTLFGLFVLGALTTQYTKRVWYKTGLRMLIVGGLALAAGYFVGTYSHMWFG